ncbi:potassium transporter 10-like [Camellia sinensis]|uniref:potassium transporter 10-like n=1 Tax=Camellia sinensis TaxID=4442 RepID=UPI001035B6D7|nr:potassium transporter 10-like [Camellia sinensis]
MRQVGVLCAAALVAVQEIVGKLESDHNNAKFLAQGLNRIEGLKVVVNSVETNIISMTDFLFLTCSSLGMLLVSDVPVPAACVILICLFALQHYGSHKIGFMFAPVVILWLLLISGVSLYNICHYDPQIIYAISPTYMYRFMRRISPGSWGLLGSILLCAAGSEAMFADLGHFSKRSITVTFVCLIYPALVLCYAGQAAFISKNLGVSKDVFLLSESVPNRSIRHIFRVLSLFASAVGSQATITASFSIINQCLALGCFPRVKVIHTSDKIHGQVYIPDVNWMLMLFNIAITIGFRNISLIGNATALNHL